MVTQKFTKFNKQFGKPPYKRFTPKKATRGGYTDFFAKKPEAPLTGQINGLKAAKGEERLARAIKKKMKAGSIQNFYFRSSPGLPKGVPGWKELDFEVQTTAGTVAIAVDDVDFVHKSDAHKNQDKLNDIMIMERLSKLGRTVDIIHHVVSSDLDTQEGADKALEKVGIK